MPGAQVHPTAEISPDATIGQRTRIWNNVHVREGATIGDDCMVGKDVYVDKDVRVGNRVKVQNGALLYYPLEIHDGVFIGPQVVFTNDRVPRAVTPEGELKSEEDWERATTVVEGGASIGAGATVLPGLRVGAWAMVAAGALVTRDVAGFALVAGTPARRVGWVCRCGVTLPKGVEVRCADCSRSYAVTGDGCLEERGLPAAAGS